MYKFCILLVICGLAACQSHHGQQGQVVHHVGAITSTDLLAEFPIFAKEYQAYSPSVQELSAMKVLQGKTLLVLFGTWCHDSEREVPRLLKTIALAGLDNYQLKLVAVDFAKQEPSGLYLKHQLRHTPTFVMESKGLEVARVVEVPMVTIAQDLAAQLSLR